MEIMSRFTNLWWRHVTANDFFNIEKPLPPGPKGQEHIDVPNVPDLLEFFGFSRTTSPEDWVSITRNVRVLVDPTVSSTITFRPRPKNTRYDIPMQNSNSESSKRHPAWTTSYGWPVTTDPVDSTVRARLTTDEGLVIFVVADTAGDLFGGFLYGAAARAALTFELRIVFDQPAGIIRGISLESSDSLRRLVNSQVDGSLRKMVVDSDEEDIESIVRGRPPRSSRRGQGFGLTAEQRRVVERQAMSVTTEYLGSNGFEQIVDVGDTESFDIQMMKNEVVHICEVKGTTSVGGRIFLTRNEVAVHKLAYPNNALAIVSEIQLDRSDPPTASGGKLRFISPWEIDETRLSPLAFEYIIGSSD